MRAAVLVVVLLLTLTAPAANAERSICVEAESREVVVRCEARSSEIELTFESPSDDLPSFALTLTFQQSGDGIGEGSCSAHYSRWSGPGPTTIRAGQHCPDPFFVPDAPEPTVPDPLA